MENILGLISEWLNPEMLRSIILSWGGRVVAAIAVFVIGRILIGFITRWIALALKHAEVDPTLISFLRNLIRMTLLVFVVLTALNVLGVPTTNFLAILGAAGLAIGLALKDSLSNFSSGVMLVIFRPFRVGDFIEAAGVSGTVEQIGIFKTDLKTGDNRVIVVPNSLIYSDAIVNFSAKETRRIDLVIGIGYGDEMHRAKSLIKGVLDAEERVIKDPAANIMLLELGESSVDFAVRPWVKTSDYWATRGDLLEKIKSVLDENGLSIPYPQRDIHLVSQVAPTQ